MDLSLNKLPIELSSIIQNGYGYDLLDSEWKPEFIDEDFNKWINDYRFDYKYIIFKYENKYYKASYSRKSPNSSDKGTLDGINEVILKTKQFYEYVK